MASPAAAFLGIDVGREALGLTIITGTGATLGSLARSYSSTPTETVDPQDWWRAARTGVKELLRRTRITAASIRCIGLTGDSHGFAALDREGRSLCSVTMGPQADAAPFVDALIAQVGARNLVNLTGESAHTGATAVKLLHLKETERRVWHDLAMVLPPKDFLRYRLTGQAATCAYDATASLLGNPKNRAWSKLLLTQLGLNPNWLPPIQAGNALAGRVTPEAAKETGLHPGTPVIVGLPHVVAAAISLGVTDPGSALVELGGDGALFMPITEPLRDPSGLLALQGHSLENQWALVADGLCAESPFLWLTHEVLLADLAQARRAKREPLDALAELAAEVPPGSDGLLFLPPGRHTLSGFIGLEFHHRRGHLVRAVLESGALAVRRALAAAEALKQKPERLLVTGPCASNHLWCQILADAAGRPVHTHAGDGRDAVGAAIVAAVSVGSFKTIEEATRKLLAKPTIFQPRKAATAAYADMVTRIESLTGVPAKAPGHSAAKAAVKDQQVAEVSG